LLLGAIYPIGTSAMAAQSAYKIKQNEVAALQELLNNYQSTANEMADLQTQIDTRTEQKDLILTSYQGLDLQGSDWSGFLFQIEDNTPAGITWRTIDQDQNEITLIGVADSYNKVLEVKASLDKLDEFTSLEIISIDRIIEESPLIVPTTETDDPAVNIQTQTYDFSLTGLISEEGLR
jgi:Tfp pilus assembly protein PilN